MMYFGIPLISKGAASDWGAVNFALQQTLRSISNSEDDRFEVLIAGHDTPEIPKLLRNKVRFLQMDTPIPRAGGRRNSPEKKERTRDRSRKRVRIAEYLRGCDTGYVMFLEADDLVDRGLVRYVHERSATNGYIVKLGYRYDVASQKLWLVNDFNRICGSCGIFRFNREDLPNDDNDGCYSRKLVGGDSERGGHSTWESTAAAYNRPLQPIDYPAVMYIRNTGASTLSGSGPKSKLRVLRTKGAKRMLGHKGQRWLGYRRLTVSEELVDRFQLHAYLPAEVNGEERG